MTNPILVKVCGMREAENIREVEQTGADMIGFIFYPKSPRYVREVPEYLPLRAKRVGVFVNENIETIRAVIVRFGLHCIQLHGEESPEHCRLLRQPGIQLIKAFSVSGAEDLQLVDLYEGLCDYYLFDTKCDGHGGAGRTFDWNVLNEYKGHTPFLLSGGIDSNSIRTLKAFTHPRFAGIDINSRFEISPGRKDPERIACFLKELASNN